MRRFPVAAPCLVSETTGCRLVSSMEFDAALPDSKSAARPRHSPSQKDISPPSAHVSWSSYADGAAGEEFSSQTAPLTAFQDQSPDETSAFSPGSVAFPSAAASFLLRRTDERNDQAISTTPTRPVMTSLISYWIVTRRITARAPIA